MVRPLLAGRVVRRDLHDAARRVHHPTGRTRGLRCPDLPRRHARVARRVGPVAALRGPAVRRAAAEPPAARADRDPARGRRRRADDRPGDRRRRRDGPAAATAVVVGALPAVPRRRLERQSADPARAADPRRGRSDRGLPEALCDHPDRPDIALAGRAHHGDRVRRDRADPAVGRVHRPLRDAVRGAPEAIGRRAVRHRDAVAARGRDPGVDRLRSRADGLAGGAGPLAVDAVVLLDAGRPGTDAVAGALMALQIPGATVAAAVAVAIQAGSRSWPSLRKAWGRHADPIPRPPDGSVYSPGQ